MSSYIFLFIASERFRCFKKGFQKKINRSFKTVYLYLYIVGFMSHSIKSRVTYLNLTKVIFYFKKVFKNSLEKEYPVHFDLENGIVQ